MITPGPIPEPYTPKSPVGRGGVGVGRSLGVESGAGSGGGVGAESGGVLPCTVQMLTSQRPPNEALHYPSPTEYDDHGR